MNQSERRIYLIQSLLKEQSEYQNLNIPQQAAEQKQLLRALLNVRMPKPIDNMFLKIQDEYLQEELLKKGIIPLDSLSQIRNDIYLWKGDITVLAADAIVNAANSQMTGCYIPNHACIDNCIHTFSGVQLRLACKEIMERQGYEESAGQAKITSGYNLPAKYVIHTVGPIVQGELTQKHKKLLASCYRSCLLLAEEYQLKSIAFCCISTGVFHFPNEEAAKIAIQTVMDHKKKCRSSIKVIFNVFKQEDYDIYERQLKNISKRSFLSY